MKRGVEAHRLRGVGRKKERESISVCICRLLVKRAYGNVYVCFIQFINITRAGLA